MKLRFSGQRALILGGSCDLGLSLARELVVQGLFPILTYRNDAGKNRILETFRGMDGQFATLHVDLSQKQTLEALDPVLAENTDYLVDFAQEDLEGLVASVDPATVAAFVETNIANRAVVIQKVSRAMVSRRKGRMVYVSSSAAGNPNPGQGYYASAKLASEALYCSVGLELAPRGVTTVTLRPGYVYAGRGQQFLKKNADAALEKVPLGRALEIDEVVDSILFLLSDSAKGFNATVLTMDGGLSSGK